MTAAIQTCPYSSRGSYCFKDMLVSDINDYRTKNSAHPSKNMSMYGTKFAFLLEDNNNKTCHSQYVNHSVIGLISSQ